MVVGLGESGLAVVRFLTAHGAHVVVNDQRDRGALGAAGDEAEAREAADKAGSIISYGASKLALARWIRKQSITPEWIGQGINLNAVAPGMVETAMIAEGRADPILSKALDNFEIPAGRMGKASEIASLVCFMLGTTGRFMVGSIVYIDGGTDAQYRTNDWPAPIHEM